MGGALVISDENRISRTVLTLAAVVVGAMAFAMLVAHIGASIRDTLGGVG
jgi:hypothetical protein